MYITHKSPKVSQTDLLMAALPHRLSFETAAILSPWLLFCPGAMNSVSFRKHLLKVIELSHLFLNRTQPDLASDSWT